MTQILDEIISRGFAEIILHISVSTTRPLTLEEESSRHARFNIYIIFHTVKVEVY